MSKFSAECAVAIVEIYSSVWCPFCYRAKRLLEQKGVDYKEIEVSDDPTLKSEMLSRADGRCDPDSRYPPLCALFAPILR